MSKIDKIKERIRALRAKASDAASTEAEAAEAASLAAKLMMKHDVAESELGREASSDDMTTENTGYETKIHPVRYFTANAIAKLTETVVLINKTRGRETLEFNGAVSDVEMALYLSEMLTAASDRVAMQAYANLPLTRDDGSRRGKEQFGFDFDTGETAAGNRFEFNTFLKGFQKGFIYRVSERLLELAKDRQGARPTGTDLVVRKEGLIKRYLRDKGISIESGRRRSMADGSREGYRAGKRAGSNVGLGRPVGAGSSGPAALPGA